MLIKPYFEIPNSVFECRTLASSGMNLDNSHIKFAWIGNIPNTGNLTRVGIRVDTNSHLHNVKVRLYNVNTDGTPNESSPYKGVSSYAILDPSLTNYAVNNLYLLDLTVAIPAERGDLVAVVFKWVNDIGDIAFTKIDTREGVIFPYHAYYTTAWHKSSFSPDYSTIVFGYGDNFYEMNTAPIKDRYNTELLQGYEVALRFKVPYECRCCGFWMYMGGDTSVTGNYPSNLGKLRLYEDDVVIYEEDWDSWRQGVQSSSSLTGLYRYSFDDVANEPVLTLNPIKVYKLALELETTASAYGTQYREIEVAAKVKSGNAWVDYSYPENLWGAISGGKEFYKVLRQSGQSWIEYITKRPLFGIFVDGLELAEGDHAGII